jgi:hypothetical protein
MYPTRSELAQLHESVRFSVALSPHYIRSSHACEHMDACACELNFSCPLCPLESFLLSEIESHYSTVHWSEKMNLGAKFVLFPCGFVHATARQSLISRLTGAGVGGFHFHCPLCATTAPSKDSMIQHVAVTHPALFNQQSQSEIRKSSISVFSESIEQRPFELPSFSVRTGFSPIVRIREFPLALSIVEQAGGRSETKKPPPCFDNYVGVHELAPMTLTDIEIVGCNRPVMKLFKDCTFLVCGIDIPSHTLSAILSLGGALTGASYLESEDWTSITHILVGDRVGSKPIKQLRRTIIARNLEPERIYWVSTDWVRERVEKGSLLGHQKMFNPILVERFFTVRDANAKQDRRRSIRSRMMQPDILGTKDEPSVEHSSRRPSPVLETAEISFQFRSTPEASPVPVPLDAAALGIVIPHQQNEHSIPFITTPRMSPMPAVVLPPLPNRPRRASIGKPAQNVVASEATPLRRSKRSAVLVSPGKISVAAHHSIKKD